MSPRTKITSLIGRAAYAVAIAMVSLAGHSATAHAAEQIVLPFECNVVGGRVQVRPSSDQAYRIYGSRRQDQYRACSERDPSRCRTFQVHSFSMACGRDPAEWPEVYAAISRVTDGRAFFNNDGALYYRMGPREPRDSYPFPEPRQALGIVEMPDGFAPIAGVDAIFTPLDPRVAELEDGSRGETNRAYDAPPPPVEKPGFAPALTAKPEPATPPVAKPADPPKAAEAAGSEVPKSEPLKSEAQKTVESPKSEVKLEPKPDPSPVPDTKPLETASTSKPETSEPRKSENSAPPIAPTILNNPAAKQVETASKSETVVAAAELAPAPQSGVPATDGTRVEGWTEVGGGGLNVPPMAFAILIAAATLATLLVILKKQAAAPVLADPMRVAIEPELPGFERPVSRSTGQSVAVREEADPPAVSDARSSANGLPATRSEALALLGLNADASEPVIRKLVEALRQSWHPDLATTDADRAEREERIKAINVAAGILLRKSAA